MIYLGGGTSAGMVAVSMPASGTVEMDKSQIKITPNLILDANGVPQVSAAVSIPSGTLSSSYNTTSGAISFSNKVTTKTITANGTYGPENGQIFNKVIVNVAGSGSGTVKAQAVTATPQASSQTITPAAGYDYLSSVTINPVPLDSRNGQTFRSNVTVTAADGKWFKSFTIAVPNSGSSGTSNIQISKNTNIDNAVSSNLGSISIEPDSGYDGMAQVVIDTTNLFAILEEETDQEQANEYILSGVSGYQVSAAHGAHALRPVRGSMTNHGAVSATLNHTTKSYTIGKGYHNGSGSITLGSNSSAPSVTRNGTVATYDNNGNYYDSIVVNVPTSTGTTLSLTNFTLSSNTESIFRSPDNTVPTRDFSINSIIDGYTIKPPFKGNTALSTRYDAMDYIIIPPLAQWSNGNKLVDIRNFNPDDTPTDNVLSSVPYYTPTVSGLEKRVGAMVNQGAITKVFTSPNESYTIPAGYHNGAGTVSINLQFNAYYIGTTTPDNALGNNGDIYLKI